MCLWSCRRKQEFVIKAKRRLGPTLIKLDQGILIWHKDSKPFGIMACFVDDVLWGGNTEFENIVNKLKQMFYISSDLISP